MNATQQLEQRVREIGHEIFERAAAAMPAPWRKDWWLEAMTRFVERDDVLKTRSFQFVECLPALKDDAALIRHLHEYLGSEQLPLPGLFRRAVRNPNPRSLANSFIAQFARFGAAQMAGRYIAAHDRKSTLATIERLRRHGMTFTLDVLGESTTSHAQAERYLQAYLDLIDAVAPALPALAPVPILNEDTHGSMPRLNLSVKLTSLDPYFDPLAAERTIRVVSDRLRVLLRRARQAGAFVNVDLESTRVRSLTFELFKRLLLEDEFRDWEDIGIVVQAYLRDGEQDLAGLLEWGKQRGARFAIRLVKGAYWDAETAAAVRNYKTPPVWTRKWESDACYERMTRVMLEHTHLLRPAFASHNVRSLANVLGTAEALGLTPRDYEVQMLYGMGDPLKAAMAQMGRCVRIYLPYGDPIAGMGYMIRRLLENTSNDSFLKQGFRDRASHARLLTDPAVAQPPSGPLPKRYYVNTDPEEPMLPFTNASLTSFAVEENRRKMQDALAHVHAEAGREYPLVIAGEPVRTQQWFDSVNPARPDEVVGRIARATRADADAAIAAAQRAFARWRLASAKERSHLLKRVADRMEERRFELAATMILEVGKPWREADADITEAVDHWRFYAEQIVQFEARPRRRNVPGETNVLLYSPKGVCVVISPWSFPLALLCGMTSAALAAGNTVIMKPASPASVLGAKLMQVFQEAGLPAGVVSYLPCDGATVGPYLVEHAGVNVVAYTGSSDVGTKVIQSGARVAPGQGYIKKMIVEMGGKNAIIVDDDADVDGAVHGVMESAFAYSGQKCSACSRVVLLPGVETVFLSRLVEAVESLPLGPAEDPATVIGPIIDQKHRQKVLEYIEIGRREAKVLVEGNLPRDPAGGFYVAPIIFDQVPLRARIAQEEIFGPILSIVRAKDFDEALAIANGTRYALTGGLYSRSPDRIARAQREFAVGNLYINRKITGSQVDVQPFGGFKLSGTGVKAGSPDYILHFMDARCITENTLRSGLVPQEEAQAAATH
ncbi:MAG TPA: proline dehydrogenase family protein [Phycisphaerae bacterium]|nr:proline dehydrogenase family protein [Phycisphaerae bacterium]HNU46832.1 proline dehydrogenase family protein [Phycisphaerae bacterium]